MKVAYIIVSYNSYTDIVCLLDSIESQEDKPDTIIVVDNVSPNGDGQRLQDIEKDRNIRVIQSSRNGGFAYGCNIGIRQAQELGMTHIGLINPDATLRDPRYLSKIKDAFETTDYEMIGTYVVNKDTGKIEFGGADIGRYTCYPHIRHRGMPYTYLSDKVSIEGTDYATGSSLFMSLELYGRVGPLDESYFMYFEETDYCMRARALGYDIGILSHTAIDHATSSSVGRMSAFYVRYMIWNFARFAYSHAKWYQGPGWLIVYLLYWIPGLMVSYMGKKGYKKILTE